MGNFLDIAGRRYGRLVALRGLSNGALGKWIFRCDCGKEKLFYKQNVVQGKTRSCGCLAAEITAVRTRARTGNLVKKKFNRLTVLRQLAVPGKHTRCICHCDCGKEVNVTSASIKNGTTKSCGCQSIYRHGKGEVGLRLLYYRYKNRSKYRLSSKNIGGKFGLSMDEFKRLTSEQCYYCGAEPACISKNKSEHSEYIYNGLDRVDSNEGYIISNVVPCCEQCNRMKLDYSRSEFKWQIQKIFNHWALRED